MKVELENISSIKQGLVVEAPEDVVEKAYKSAMEKIRKEAKVPGFRPGKIPDQLIYQRFKDDLELEATKFVVRETYLEAVKESGVKPLTAPEIEPKGKIEKGKPFTYKATFEIYPEVKVKDYEGLKLEREKLEVTDEEVEAELKRMQARMTQLEPVQDGELGPGMVAMIDFQGTAGGKPFQGSDVKDYVVDFGGGHLLPEFEFKIKGMKVSEERDIRFKYPEDYFKKEMAGQEGEFKVRIKDLRRKIVPEMNDDFAKDLGKFETIEDVRKDVKTRIGEYKENYSKNLLREQAIRQLVEKHKELEVPTSFIDAELGNMLDQLERQYKARGVSLANEKIDAKEFVKANLNEATDRARGYMIVKAITGEQKIEVSDDEVEARISIIAGSSGQPLAKVKEHFEKDDNKGKLHSQMTFEKTLDFILSKAKISETMPKKKK